MVLKVEKVHSTFCNREYTEFEIAPRHWPRKQSFKFCIFSYVSWGTRLQFLTHLDSILESCFLSRLTGGRSFWDLFGTVGYLLWNAKELKGAFRALTCHIKCSSVTMTKSLNGNEILDAPNHKCDNGWNMFYGVVSEEFHRIEKHVLAFAWTKLSTLCPHLFNWTKAEQGCVWIVKAKDVLEFVWMAK